MPRQGDARGPPTAPPATAEGAPVDPAVLERFRQSGLSIDGEGRFWHEGQLVTHAGMRRAFFRWLDRLPPPDGRHILRLDDRRFVYIEVADTPLVASSLRWSGDTALLGLTDATEEPLDPTTLTVDGAGVLRCHVHAGRLEARLSTSAAAVLGEHLDDTTGTAVLRLASRSIPVRPR